MQRATPSAAARSQRRTLAGRDAARSYEHFWWPLCPVVDSSDTTCREPRVERLLPVAVRCADFDRDRDKIEMPGGPAADVQVQVALRQMRPCLALRVPRALGGGACKRSSGWVAMSHVMLLAHTVHAHQHARAHAHGRQTLEVRSQIKAMIKQGKSDDQILLKQLPGTTRADLAKVTTWLAWAVGVAGKVGRAALSKAAPVREFSRLEGLAWRAECSLHCVSSQRVRAQHAWIASVAKVLS